MDTLENLTRFESDNENIVEETAELEGGDYCSSENSEEGYIQK